MTTKEALQVHLLSGTKSRAQIFNDTNFEFVYKKKSIQMLLFLTYEKNVD